MAEDPDPAEEKQLPRELQDPVESSEDLMAEKGWPALRVKLARLQQDKKRLEEDLQPELARSYSRSFSHPEAMGLLERHNARLLWSEEQQVPYAFYSNGGVFEWLFLEDARSFGAKLDLVEEYDLRGFSAWVLGSEDREIWQVLDPESR